VLAPIWMEGQLSSVVIQRSRVANYLYIELHVSFWSLSLKWQEVQLGSEMTYSFGTCIPQWNLVVINIGSFFFLPLSSKKLMKHWGSY
jgi:hypothetical protein